MNASERELLIRFVDDLTDYAIIMLDVHGRVLTWNAGARALLGYAAEDFVGRPRLCENPSAGHLGARSIQTARR